MLADIEYDIAKIRKLNICKSITWDIEAQEIALTICEYNVRIIPSLNAAPSVYIFNMQQDIYPSAAGFVRYVSAVPGNWSEVFLQPRSVNIFTDTLFGLDRVVMDLYKLLSSWKKIKSRLGVC